MTVIAKLLVVPAQPLADGVTTILDTVGALVPFSAVKDGMLPRPVPARPVAVLSFVQLKVEPVTVPE